MEQESVFLFDSENLLKYQKKFLIVKTASR